MEAVYSFPEWSVQHPDKLPRTIARAGAVSFIRVFDGIVRGLPPHVRLVVD
jgi:hypothetical protein